jgi:ABC-type sugar transport system substrate-binding protein
MDQNEKIVIGFSNLEERSDYAIAVRESLEAACRKHPNIELICRDNDWDDGRALENARFFAEQEVDLAIIYHINEQLGPQIQSTLMPIPIICIDIPISLTTYVGIDNEGMGQQLGDSLRKWVNQNWQGQEALVIGLIDSRVRFAQPRVLVALDELKKSDLSAMSSIFLDMRYNRDKNIETIAEVIQREADGQRKIIFVAYNGESATCALEVIQSQRVEGIIATQGMTSDEAELVQDRTSPLIMGTISHPDQYGELLVDVALKRVRRERVASSYYVPLTFIS